MQNSLCILDELGRGTATFDGTAIAHAVVSHVVGKLRCRALFATHYHTLVDDWSVDPRVQLGHMDCIVEGQQDSGDVEPMDVSTSEHNRSDEEFDDDKNCPKEEVTFLYRLCNGSCPKSYGINVGRLAHLPDDVIMRAIKQSKAFASNLCATNANIGIVWNSSQLSQNSPINAVTKDMISVFYEKLVFLAESGIEGQELCYVASEIWRRFKHTVANPPATLL